jgi:hypothetical protein
MNPASVFAAALLALVPLVAGAQGAAPAPAASGGAAEKTIPGVVLNRPDGRFLGVETDGVTLKITFYDKEKDKEKVDVVRIAARWTDTQPRRAVLLPAGESAFVSTPVFRRPFNYLVHLALVGADDQVKESHSLRLQ